MNKLLLILTLLLIAIAPAKADALFNPGKLYFITCYDIKRGGIEPAAQGNYPLVYNVNASENTEKALWVLTEEEPEKYSVKNYKTGQYMEYAPANSAGKFIKMSSKLNGDFTLFTFNPHKKENNITYWTIAPAGNPGMAFDRRSYNAVGPYQAQQSSNQFFSFKEQGGKHVQALFLAGEPGGYLKSFAINRVELVYEKAHKTYYCSIPIEQMNSDFRKTVHYVPGKSGYTLKIEKQPVASGATFTFPGVTADKVFTIQVVENETVLQTAKLVFTGLPIVQLFTEGNRLRSTFSPGKIKVTENNKALTGELLNADIRYRGATSMIFYSKKSFAVKLKDEYRKGIDRSYFGFRSDNYWILDAMASDVGRMRNRVCTDLWNDFSAAPYFKKQETGTINGTRGQFVEVFIDNQYWGLYCMTERVDRKQLGLKKYQKEPQSIRGVLYKSSDWSHSTLMGRMRGGQNRSYGIPKYNNSSERWDSYEAAYPKLREKQSITWKPLYEMISFVVTSDNSTFKSQIAERIDFPVWLDYYLFMELIYARDNHGKNLYFYIQDINEEKKMGLTPWDLDGTWGRDWDREETNPAGNFLNYMRNHSSGEHHLYRRLRETDAENYNSLLKKRYNELRHTHFSKNNLIQRLDDYLNLFIISGARKREENRWNVMLPLDEEINYMKKWISERVDFLNMQYSSN